MRLFRDAEKREWSITVNVRAVKAMRSVGVDIMDDRGEGILALSSDVVKMCDCIWTLCKLQAEQRGITEDQFFDAMSGDALDAAASAMVDAIIDFFPSARRDLMRRANEKAVAMQQKALELAGAKIDAMDCDSFMSLPESQELTQKG